MNWPVQGEKIGLVPDAGDAPLDAEVTKVRGAARVFDVRFAGADEDSTIAIQPDGTWYFVTSAADEEDWQK